LINNENFSQWVETWLKPTFQAKYSDKKMILALDWFVANKNEMRWPKLVVDFEKNGWAVLFTPPHCPDLQLIEIFWANGKNWARVHIAVHDQKMPYVIDLLRVGWYGDGIKKKGVKCASLVKKAIEKANERIAADKDENGVTILTGKVHGGSLKVADGHGLSTGIDLMGRVTREMSRHACGQGTNENPALTGNPAGDRADVDGTDDGDGDDDGGYESA
jgi:hypothetical protein